MMVLRHLAYLRIDLRIFSISAKINGRRADADSILLGEYMAKVVLCSGGRRPKEGFGESRQESSWLDLKTTDDLCECRSSPRTESLVAAAMQQAERNRERQ
jgi:hypothetical protein